MDRVDKSPNNSALPLLIMLPIYYLINALYSGNS